VETIIAGIAEKFIKNVVKTLAAGENFSEIEQNVGLEVAKCAAEVTCAYMEHLDEAILSDKAGRREAGYTVQRRGDERELLTLFGEVKYSRTYYKKAVGGYEYLADRAMGIESRARLSAGVGLSLVGAAKEMSYAKASRYITKETVSRQTVMGRVRQSAAELPEPECIRCVPELHIDADEAHITLRGGRKSEVPLISVYEGIGLHGKRTYCKNVFHISEYGKTPDDLWEQALSEIERRYDLTGTRIYLHGDGGGWIQTGLEWLPEATFVLDKYHKNKAIKAMTAGLDRQGRNEFDRAIRKALNDEDIGFFDQLAGSLCIQLPERVEKIIESAGYLKRFVSGISICATDPGANNGGCTEPHVSHVLSARLSSRPMAWSRMTLQKLAPILAAGRVDSIGKAESKSLPKPLQKAAVSANRAFCRGTIGSPAPDAIGRLPLSGKVTGTQKILKLFA
jgi:hypothetical protein